MFSGGQLHSITTPDSPPLGTTTFIRHSPSFHACSSALPSLVNDEISPPNAAPSTYLRCKTFSSQCASHSASEVFGPQTIDHWLPTSRKCKNHPGSIAQPRPLVQSDIRSLAVPRTMCRTASPRTQKATAQCSSLQHFPEGKKKCWV